ncbi:hypothetical protein [Azonexus hydrophilus]|uniref:hypothetical protein n=1 Tax=Azonexus hydrophilus TaxID=418702 RepID=UPI00248FBC18|nr:hypothetical protein [Azonexus hydrophilus]
MMQTTNTVLEDIAAEIGFGATVRLAAVYGGSTIRIPTKCSDGHPLVKLLGHTCVGRLAVMFPSPETLDVPNLAEFERWRKVKAVASLASRDVPKADIATLTAMSPRHVGNMLKLAAKVGLVEAKPDRKPAGDPDTTPEIRVLGPAEKS